TRRTPECSPMRCTTSPGAGSSSSSSSARRARHPRPTRSRPARNGSSSFYRRHSTRASEKARGSMSSFDMDKLMQQAAQMQEQVARMQEEAENETAQSSVGGGLVKVTANGAGQVIAIEISPDAIDPEDPEALADLILAGVNEALRSAQAGVDAK